MHFEFYESEQAKSMKKTNRYLEAIVPKTKRAERALVKACEKYGGRFDKLTDLARMTFVCGTLGAAHFTLQFIKESRDWEIVRIKNRLLLSLDTSREGGTNNHHYCHEALINISLHRRTLTLVLTHRNNIAC